MGCITGLTFQQEAIFFIKGDDLFVSYCDHRRGLVKVGGFRKRLQLPDEMAREV